MATKYIDVNTRIGINDVPLPTDTSTVTNKVRVAWDTSISRHDLAQTLKEISEAVLDNSRFTQASTFVDS
jgi:hypothetical protein